MPERVIEYGRKASASDSELRAGQTSARSERYAVIRIARVFLVSSAAMGSIPPEVAHGHFILAVCDLSVDTYVSVTASFGAHDRVNRPELVRTAEISVAGQSAYAVPSP